MVIDSIPALILALGGDVAISRNLKAHQCEVHKWAASGAIPNGWHLRLYLAAVQHGHTVDLALFELDDWHWHWQI